MTTDVVVDMLESVGVRNMMSDSDESEDSDEDVKFDVDWVQRIGILHHHLLQTLTLPKTDQNQKLLRISTYLNERNRSKKFILVSVNFS